MFPRQSSAIHEFLQEQRLVSPVALAALHAEHEATGRPLAALAVEGGLITREELLVRLARQQGLGYLPVLPEQLSGEAIAAVPGDLARTYGVLPLQADAQGLALIITDPFNAQAHADLMFALDRPVRLLLADPDVVEARIRQHYGHGDETLGALLGGIDPSDVLPGDGVSDRDLSARDLAVMAEQAPIIAFVDLIIGRAIRDQASDIHFEPFEDEFKIRYRVDGALYELAPPSPRLALPIISRVKVLASLNIAERRLPQDGRIRLTVDGRSVDLRVSTLPTQFGESVVLRILDQSAVRLEITQLGMPEEVLDGVQDILCRPNGIFVVTGPTGSGKTTTLYSGLRVLNTTGLKLLTAEDPVEYEIEGIMQVSVNPAVGLTFASALRSFLRQHPDVIMVGEIRDFETAQVAIQASLTGHLVLSTLHTNDAAGAVTRLIDLGVEPFLIASTLEAVLAQRLVRRVCTACRTAYVPAPDLLRQLGLGEPEGGQPPFCPGPGCPACNHSGYKGRLGIYEWLRVTEGIRSMVTQRAPTLAIRNQAVAQGMRTLRQAGRRAVFDGHTSVDEVIKYT